jgi:hypothetical protein
LSEESEHYHTLEFWCENWPRILKRLRRYEYEAAPLDAADLETFDATVDKRIAKVVKDSGEKFTEQSKIQDFSEWLFRFGQMSHYQDLFKTITPYLWAHQRQMAPEAYLPADPACVSITRDNVGKLFQEQPLLYVRLQELGYPVHTWFDHTDPMIFHNRASAQIGMVCRRNRLAEYWDAKLTGTRTHKDMAGD